jgi:hypothetical protein
LVEEKTKSYGREILFASKQNRVICFACFASKRNSRYRIQNQKETKRNAARKASNCETKLSENTRSEIERNKAKFQSKTLFTRNKKLKWSRVPFQIHVKIFTFQLNSNLSGVFGAEYLAFSSFSLGHFDQIVSLSEELYFGGFLMQSVVSTAV